MEVAPQVHFGMLPLLIILFAFIGLIIFLVKRFGKESPGRVGLIIGGFIIAIMAMVFLPVFFGIAIPVFILPMVLGMGFAIFMLVKAGGGKLVAVVVIGGGLVLVAFFGLHFVRGSRQVAYDNAVAPTVVEQAVPSVWREGVDEQFLADVYPSKRAAASAMDRRLVDVLHELCGEDHGKISVLAGSVEDTYVKDMTKLLGGHAGRFLAEGEGPSDVVVEFSVVDVESIDAPWSTGVDKKSESGKFEATVRSGQKSSTVQVGFVEKPWVENFSSFLSRNPDSQVVLVRSSGSCTSQVQAHQQAIGQACRQVSATMRGMQADTSILPPNFDVTDSEVNSAGLIVDRFTQRFSGLAGPIWREAILVDTSEKKLSALADKKIGATRARRQTWGQMALTLLGMFVLISVVYMFLNAATRGYYSWALRIALIVLMGVGVFVILMLA